MPDERAPDDQTVEESRQLKEAVARLGASLREESERLKADEVPELPIPAAPRDRPDPRVDTLTDQVTTLVGLQEAAARQAEEDAATGASERRAFASDLAAASRLAR